MSSDGAHTYYYDAEQRIIQVDGTLGTCSTATVCYTYDGDGLRVKKSSGTLYWRSITGDVLAETDSSGNTQNEYVFFSGRRIAQRTSSGSVYFYYADTLGTIHTITNGTGTACYDATFTPYGDEMLNPNISQTCSSNYKFTGYEYDSETGLYYAKARYYNPRLGRFMTTDPLGGGVTDPQSLNRYAYVINQPTTLIDPRGMDNCIQGKGAGRSVSCQNGGNQSSAFDLVNEFGFLNLQIVEWGWYAAWYAPSPSHPDGCQGCEEYLPVPIGIDLHP